MKINDADIIPTESYSSYGYKWGDGRIENQLERNRPLEPISELEPIYTNSLITKQTPAITGIPGTNFVFDGTLTPPIKFREMEPREVALIGQFPKPFKKESLVKLIYSMNQQLVSYWKKSLSPDHFDIDVQLQFKKDPEDLKLEVIYTVYIPDLKKEEIKKVWYDLRKSFDKLIDKTRTENRKLRKEIENYAKVVYIQLDW
jgi:hypothetical protein